MAVREIPSKLGKWQVGNELGRGGMGTVYEAVSTEDGSPGAVKVLSFDLAKDLEYLKRFRREIKAGTSISSENVVKVLDWGDESGCHYFVMELLQGGRDLSQVLKEDGPLEPESVVRIGIGLCSALEALHDNSVVHRDIKPGNIMLLPDGTIKLMDLGLARILDRTALTVTGEALGSPRYMAPEILLGKVANFQSDVYQVGVLLYELLAGEPAFDSENFERLLHIIIEEPAPDIRIRAKGVPEALAKTIEKCIEKKPPDRFESVKVLSSHFQAMLDDGFDAVFSEPSVPEEQPEDVRSQSGKVASSRSGRSSSLKSSSSFSMNTKQEPGIDLRRLVLPFGILGVLALLVFFFVFRTSAPAVDPEVSIVQGLKAVEVRWKTGSKLPSVVRVADESKNVQAFSNELEKEVLSHRVLLTNLTENTRYRVKLYGVPKEEHDGLSFERISLPVAKDFQVNRDGKVLTVSGLIPDSVKATVKAVVGSEELLGYDKTTTTGGLVSGVAGTVSQKDVPSGYKQTVLQVNGIPPYSDVTVLRLVFRDYFSDSVEIGLNSPPGTVTLLKTSVINQIPLPSAVKAFVKESNLFFADASYSYDVKKQVYDLLLAAGVNDSLFAPFVRWTVSDSPDPGNRTVIKPSAADLPVRLVPQPFTAVKPVSSPNELKSGRLYIFRLEKAVKASQTVSLFLVRTGIGEGARLRILAGEDFQIVDKEHFRNNRFSKVSFPGACVHGRKLVIVRVIAESLAYNNEDAEEMVLKDIGMIVE